MANTAVNGKLLLAVGNPNPYHTINKNLCWGLSITDHFPVVTHPFFIFPFPIPLSTHQSRGVFRIFYLICKLLNFFSRTPFQLLASLCTPLYSGPTLTIYGAARRSVHNPLLNMPIWFKHMTLNLEINSVDNLSISCIICIVCNVSYAKKYLAMHMPKFCISVGQLVATTTPTMPAAIRNLIILELQRIILAQILQSDYHNIGTVTPFLTL